MNSVSTIRTSIISETESYTDKIYDETVKCKIKKEILLEFPLQHRFPAKKKETNTLKSLSKASMIKSPLSKAK